jgi:DNA-directed RNA polymerase
MPTIEDQKELEYEMVQAGVVRYEAQNMKLLNQGAESRTKYGRALIASMVTKVAEGVEELQQPSPASRRCVARRKLAECNPEQVAYLGLLSVVDAISKRYSLLKVARNVGMFIEDQQRIQEWLDAEGEIAKNVLKKAEEKSTRRHKRAGIIHKMKADGYNNEWSNEERIMVGVRLIDIIIARTGIIHLQRLRTARNKTTTFVQATPETLAWIRNFNEYASHRKPRYAPCIVPPKEWDGVWGGGYYSDVINRLPLVRAH